MNRVLLALLVAGGLALPALILGPGRASAVPDDALIGQWVTACTYDADLEIVVAWAERTAAVAGAPAPAGSLWVVLLIDVTNVSDKAEALTSRPLELHDGAGRVFPVHEDPPDPADVAAAYGVHWPWHEFQPGLTERSVLTFLVPEDAGPLSLVGRRDYC